MIHLCPSCKLDITHLKFGSLQNHIRWCKKTEYTQKDKLAWSKIQELYDSGYSIKECAEYFNCTCLALLSGVKIGLLKVRSKSDSRKLFLKKNGNRKHSEETKQKIKKIALNSPHRRLKKKTIMYKGVLLDSSWELELATVLDKLGIEWVRPKPISLD